MNTKGHQVAMLEHYHYTIYVQHNIYINDQDWRLSKRRENHDKQTTYLIITDIVI